jgi:hypothetical protein
VLHFPKGGEAVLDFSFNDLYSFLLTVLGMYFAYHAKGDKDKHNKQK